MSDLTNKILDAIDIVADDKVSSVKFDKTVRATIVESVDPSVGKYKVKYQNSTFFAYANDLKSYSKGSAIYVVIPSGNFESHPYIVGTVSKLGSNYLDILSIEDRVSQIGGNILTTKESAVPISFCSYKSFDTRTNTQVLYEPNKANNIITIDELGLDIYKENSDTILLGANFQTKLSAEQQISGGNYGIRMYCEYYDARYKDLASKKEAAAELGYITRTYELNINKMTGQPYNLFNSTPQKTYFEIDAENFVRISKIEAFCSSFPVRKKGSGVNIEGTISEDETKFYDRTGQLVTTDGALYYATNTKKWYQYNKAQVKWENQSDIFIENFKMEFYETLTEEELQGISLRIAYPLGSYFLNDDADTVVKKLQADLRIKGKRVNYEEQAVHFYWFVKNIRVTHDSPEYNQYGGPGWECLNTKYVLPQSESQEGTATGYNPDGPVKSILHKDCPGLVTRYKCVAIYRNEDGTNTQVSAEGELTNRSKLNSKIIIDSTLGESFAFNIGKTSLRCSINDVLRSDYTYYWGRGIDGDEITLYDSGKGKHTIANIDISMAYHFVTYECSVYDGNNNLIGTGNITLTNGEPIGEYRLVLKDGSRVYKYNGNGIAPNSSALDKYDRIAIPALTFDIYNDLGQIVNMTDEEKKRMCEIMWVWPYASQPTESKGNNTTHMIRTNGETVTQRDVPDPMRGTTTNKKYVTMTQPILSYNINNNYDIDLASVDNNIELVVVFKEQILRAKTNFTFTKDGEQGTNGTPYITRIVPKIQHKTSEQVYEQIVIIGTALYGRIGNSYTKLDTNKVNDIFKVELWRDGATPNIPDINTEYPGQLLWSTSTQDRGNTNYLTIVQKDGIINITNAIKTTPNNTTLKAKLNVKLLSENENSYFDSYPLDVMVDSTYRIVGGYREVTYHSDGSRSGFVKKPFILEKFSSSTGWVPVKETKNNKIGWWTNWNTNNKKPTTTGNSVTIEPRASYESQNINTWIKAVIKTDDDVDWDTANKTKLVAYVPIDYHLDRYGLGAINDWDGNSIKINNTGDKYILSPQVGAGTRETDGTFTGITIGKAFDNGEKVGLLGYHQGQRSIFLDSKTGNAEFGKSGAGRIILGPTQRGIAPLGAIYSGNYYKNNSTTGYPERLNNAGMLIDLAGARIHFGSGNFEVDANGYLTAKGVDVDGTITARKLYASEEGYIAGWKITSDRLTSQNNAIYLDSDATDANDVIHTPGFQVRANGSFKAGNNFAVDVNGNLTANGGKIAGWNFNDTQLYHNSGKNRMFMNSSGSIGGGTGGTYKGGGYSDLKWTITNEGVGYFSDVFINNDTRGKDKANIISIGNKSGESGGGTFTVNNKGEMTSSKADIDGKITSKEGEIGGWTINANSISNGGISLNASGTITLGSNYTLSGSGTGSASGKTTSGSGSNLSSGHVTGSNGGYGGGSCDWDAVSIVGDYEDGKYGDTITGVSVSVDPTTGKGKVDPFYVEIKVPAPSSKASYQLLTQKKS